MKDFWRSVEENTPSLQILDQRVRNRIIDQLDLCSSYEIQLQYEKDVPIADVPAEVIQGWFDWSPEENLKRWGPPVYTEEEVQALQCFHHVIDVVADLMGDEYSSVADVQSLPVWDKLRAAAAQTLAVLAKRGKLDEDAEIPA
jgi:hypothetical protein